MVQVGELFKTLRNISIKFQGHKGVNARTFKAIFVLIKESNGPSTMFYAVWMANIWNI